MTEKVGISVGASNGVVMIDFEKPVSHLEFDPRAAGEFIGAVIGAVEKLDKTSSGIVLPGAGVLGE